MRASSNGRKLSNSDAALVKGMINRGDRQHDIASVFAVNGGRIGEVSTGENFSGVSPATSGLPPKAPYLVISAHFRALLKELRKELSEQSVSAASLEKLDALVRAFDESHKLRGGQ